MEDRHAQRTARLQEAMSTQRIDHLWVEPSVGFYYLTGVELASIERLAGLLVPAEGSLRLMVPVMLEAETDALQIETISWDDAEGPESASALVLKDVSHLHVQGSLPMWAAESLRAARPDLVLDPGTLSGLRERKDEYEVELIRRSGAFTDSVVEDIARLDLSGLSERELAGRIQGHYLEAGHKPGEWTLVASGAKAAMPHYAGQHVPISRDEPLLCDLGGTVEGYWSDITRVFFPKDRSSEIETAYETVCAAYDAAFAAVEPGVPCAEVDRAARSVIETAGYGEAFLHRTGHGVGLELHEAPYIRAGNGQRLEIGHVFSIEPGIYLAGKFGLRYENVVCLTEDGPEAVNTSPRDHFFA